MFKRRCCRNEEPIREDRTTTLKKSIFSQSEVSREWNTIPNHIRQVNNSNNGSLIHNVSTKCFLFSAFCNIILCVLSILVLLFCTSQPFLFGFVSFVCALFCSACFVFLFGLLCCCPEGILKTLARGYCHWILNLGETFYFFFFITRCFPLRYLPIYVTIAYNSMHESNLVTGPYNIIVQSRLEKQINNFSRIWFV